MTEIKKEYDKNGYTLKLIESEKLSDKRIKAIYSVNTKDEKKIRGYETQIVTIRIQSNDFHGIKKGDIVMVHPSNAEFGRFGWYFQTLIDAENKYRDIVAERSQS